MEEGSERKQNPEDAEESSELVSSGCFTRELRAVLATCTSLDPPTVYRGWGGAHEATPPEELQAANVPGVGGHIPQWRCRRCKAALAQVDNTPHHAALLPCRAAQKTRHESKTWSCWEGIQGGKGGERGRTRPKYSLFQ